MLLKFTDQKARGLKRQKIPGPGNANWVYFNILVVKFFWQQLKSSNICVLYLRETDVLLQNAKKWWICVNVLNWQQRPRRTANYLACSILHWYWKSFSCHKVCLGDRTTVRNNNMSISVWCELAVLMQVMAKITFSKLADDEVANITRIGASNNGQVARRKKLQGNEWFIPKEGKKYAGLHISFPQGRERT